MNYKELMELRLGIRSQTKQRVELEAKALEAICACYYYDLIDNLENTTDVELLEIIENKVKCAVGSDM